MMGRSNSSPSFNIGTVVFRGSMWRETSIKAMWLGPKQAGGSLVATNFHRGSHISLGSA
jgi:hypothetical protein